MSVLEAGVSVVGDAYVSVRKVLSNEQQGVVGAHGKGVRKAVAVVERRTMTRSPKSDSGFSRQSALVVINIDNLKAQASNQRIKVAISGLPEAPHKHDATLK